MNSKFDLNSFIKDPVFISVVILSIIVKVFYFVFNQSVIGPDSTEYLATSQIFIKEGIFYINSSNPFTFWRLPILPLILAIVPNLKVLYILQLLLSYLLSYFIFQIFNFFFSNVKLSVTVALCSLFLPYINICACAALTEFLQVFLIIYIFKKILYREYDYFLVISLSVLCLLRAEGFTFVLFIIIYELFNKEFKKVIILGIPLIVVGIWMFRNHLIFEKFSLVNPILSSRAMIGSIYNALYVSEPHKFHSTYNYYQGFDYVHNKEFVTEYKQLVSNEIKNYIINNPLDFLLKRLYWITKNFSYISLGGEMLPDENWHIVQNPDWNTASKINSIWSFNNLIANKDYFRLILRLLYNGILAAGNFIGLFYILLNFKKYKTVIFLFLTFSYIFIVEADMRYFLTIQIICFSFFIALVYQIISKYKSRNLT